MNTPYVKQLRTGKVKQLGTEGAKEPMDRLWTTGMFKKPQEGNLWLSKTGLTNDEVADTKVHGGPEKALFAYPEHHYDYWKRELDIEEMEAGAMGENLVMIDVDEFTTFIGDTYRFGEAVIQVSQPRQPCWKPARRFRVLDLALRIQESGRTGWYYRVIEEGHVEADSTLELIERPYPQWSVAAANEVMHEKKDDLHATYELAKCELLAESWRRRLNRRLQGKESSIKSRVYGENVDS